MENQEEVVVPVEEQKERTWSSYFGFGGSRKNRKARKSRSRSRYFGVGGGGEPYDPMVMRQHFSQFSKGPAESTVAYVEKTYTDDAAGYEAAIADAKRIILKNQTLPLDVNDISEKEHAIKEAIRIYGIVNRGKNEEEASNAVNRELGLLRQSGGYRKTRGRKARKSRSRSRKSRGRKGRKSQRRQ
jgi:hypothetical protein